MQFLLGIGALLPHITNALVKAEHVHNQKRVKTTERIIFMQLHHAPPIASPTSLGECAPKCSLWLLCRTQASCKRAASLCEAFAERAEQQGALLPFNSAAAWEDLAMSGFG